MKKLIITILAMLMLIWVFPISASAEETISAPKTVQYKLINHDKVALRWSKVEGADKYYIYKRNDETGKYIKKYEVKSNACTLNNLTAETEYSYAVVAVKEVNGKQIKSKSSNKVCFCTPSEWIYYYKQERVDGRDIRGFYVSHYDKSNGKNFDDMISSTYASIVDFDSEYEDALDMGLYIHESTLFYYENYVYYICEVIEETSTPYPSSYYLCRMKNDGTNLEVLCCLAKDNFDINIGRFTVNNGYIYISMTESYYDLDEEYIYSFQAYIYKVSIDGKEQTKIDEKTLSISGLEIYNDKIYFIANKIILQNSQQFCTEDYYLYCMDTDGTNKKIIKKLPYYKYLRYPENSMFIINNYVYYTMYNNNNYGISRVSLDDRKLEQVVMIKEYIDDYQIEYINGYFYYNATIYNQETEDNEYPYYRVKADGTGLTKSDKPFEWRY